jgi:hypothetical protein
MSNERLTVNGDEINAALDALSGRFPGCPVSIWARRFPKGSHLESDQHSYIACVDKCGPEWSMVTESGSSPALAAQNAIAEVESRIIKSSPQARRAELAAELAALDAKIAEAGGSQ